MIILFRKKPHENHEIPILRLNQMFFFLFIFYLFYWYIMFLYKNTFTKMSSLKKRYIECKRLFSFFVIYVSITYVVLFRNLYFMKIFNFYIHFVLCYLCNIVTVFTYFCTKFMMRQKRYMILATFILWCYIV